MRQTTITCNLCRTSVAVEVTHLGLVPCGSGAHEGWVHVGLQRSVPNRVRFPTLDRPPVRALGELAGAVAGEEARAAVMAAGAEDLRESFTAMEEWATAHQPGLDARAAEVDLCADCFVQRAAEVGAILLGVLEAASAEPPLRAL